MFKQIQEGTQCANLFMFMNFCLVMTLFLIASPNSKTFDIGIAGGFTFANILLRLGLVSRERGFTVESANCIRIEINNAPPINKNATSAYLHQFKYICDSRVYGFSY